MWIMSKRGFFSISVTMDTVQIRARVRDDLEELMRFGTTKLGTVNWCSYIHNSPHRDYRYRIYTNMQSLTQLLAALGEDIDYHNFKSTISAFDPDRAHTYTKIWLILQRDLDDRNATDINQPQLWDEHGVAY